MKQHLAAKTSSGLVALAVTISGCAALDNLGNQGESDATLPSPTVPNDPYEAVLLDGSTMTILAGEGALLSFTEGVPSAIHSLNLLAQSGDCSQIRDEAEAWTSQAANNEQGRVASAFASHANNVYAYIECGRAAQPVEALEVQGEIRYGSCTEAIAADGGNYFFGIDPEYQWYEDRDGDGVVCENR